MEICLNLKCVKKKTPEFYLEIVRQVFKDTCFLQFKGGFIYAVFES